MTPARTYPARRDDVRLLVVDPAVASFTETRTTALPELLRAGDLLVVNDAATLPASLRGQDARGRDIEVRLISAAACAGVCSRTNRLILSGLFGT